MRYVVSVNGERHEISLDGGAVELDGARIAAGAEELAGTPVRLVTIGDEVHRVVVRRGDARGRYTLWLDGFRYEVEALDERTHAIRALSGAASAATGPAPLKAPMPGLVVRVNVAVGDEVAAGQGLVAIEAMKMENELRAAAAGRVKAVRVAVGEAVEKGQLLVEME
ncbi:MAG: biotin attachment protein [Gemmatimonadaceae bacterium]|nr:biotin attachment protein [Gemmatimonadaceae bacterium]NUQ92712.1 biotin attachment protein [Gemmatimonadaceae bacterium]NUR20673.1 biotin attachment protein [Gemmatimonadaceae bacterium]